MTKRRATASSTPIVTKRRAILVPVGEPARMIEIDDSLQALQNIVGGRIEAFGRMRLSLDGSRVVDAWCNDDGFKVLPLNRLVLLPKFVGEIYGPILLLAADDTTGETYSLAPWELEICLAIVARWPRR